MSDLSGTILRQYHIHEMIGRGGMAKDSQDRVKTPARSRER